MNKKSLAVLLLSSLTGFGAAATESASRGVIRWDFPRLGNCHEGLAFADGVTGVLVWGGGDELRLTVGRADLWDHRGGYPWTDAQSYTNVVALWRAGEKDRLLALFKKETPAGEPRNPYLLPLGRVVVKMSGATLARGELDTRTGLGTIALADGRVLELAMSKASRAFAIRFPEGLSYAVEAVPSMAQPLAREPRLYARQNIGLEHRDRAAVAVMLVAQLKPRRFIVVLRPDVGGEGYLLGVRGVFNKAYKLLLPRVGAAAQQHKAHDKRRNSFHTPSSAKLDISNPIPALCVRLLKFALDI